LLERGLEITLANPEALIGGLQSHAGVRRREAHRDPNEHDVFGAFDLRHLIIPNAAHFLRTRFLEGRSLKVPLIEQTGAFALGVRCPQLFKITATGALTTFHRFDGADGAHPAGTLLQATDGNFYGTTYAGGSENWGTVFELTSSGNALSTLHSFDGSDGAYISGDLLQASNGTFYGTAFAGGTGGSCFDGCGTIFSESVGLGPFVITVPTARKIRQSVIILGTNLTGTTGVTFNGTAATFKVVSATEISTTVPTGATTGTVQVVTPGGTLSSNVPFRVIP
jgi:uncharacterized repeat protein (TIGR03803 family)